MRRLAVIVLLTAAMAPLHSSPNQSPQSPKTEYPFAVHNPNKEKLPSAMMVKIYGAACEGVGRELNPQKPLRISPYFILSVGGSDNVGIEATPSGMILHMKKWNEAQFAQGVAQICLYRALPPETIQGIAMYALASAGATVDVKQLESQ